MDNKEKQFDGSPESNRARDEALFEALGKSKKQKKRRIIRTIVLIVLVVAVVLVSVVSVLRHNVRERFGSNSNDVKAYQANVGTISTVVSGSGILSNVDVETVELLSGVELDEVLVEYGDPVVQNQLIATVDMSTVRSAMSDLQSQIETLDNQISDAEDDQVSSYISAGVSGRVKIIYAEKGESVADVMVDHGALAVLSLDGYMAVDIETDALSAGDSVQVTLDGGKEYKGTVDAVFGDTATVLVTDNGPEFGLQATVHNADGEVLGTGELYIHNPLAITGYAGTISNISVKENAKVSASANLFYLKDTGDSAAYDSLLRQRAELEEDLLTLLAIQKYGGITTPIAGSVFSVADLDSELPITEVASISPDLQMSVTITVDESDILSLELDQKADVEVGSVSEELYSGTVTEIDRSASSGYYTAEITLDKDPDMLPGMTANVDIRIQGVEDAILIPVAALHQTSTGYYVYTAYDAETQQYGGRVDVTVGLSNDDFVQIETGLQVGDTVYYTETMNIFDFFANMAGMGGGQSGGGQMPAGQMPGGDFGGGQMPGGFGG